MRTTLAISLMLLSWPVFAQTLPDSLKLDTAAIKKSKFLPTGLRIGTDLISIVKSQTQDDFSGWEINADVDLYRYLFEVDYGKSSRSYPGDSSAYSNDGNFWRIGLDANFLTRDEDRNVFFIGLRYGRARYSEQMSIIPRDENWGDGQRHTFSNNDLTAHWMELNGGLKVKIWEYVWLGFTGRLKFGLSENTSNPMLTHEVPGYGRTDRDTYWGFNYYVFFRIPFRKAYPILPPKKKK
ncbi:DUF6048 family protein [Chryseosolibacter indicus]|uniref:DUF3575 domain-containing protein n=1 Tax=Chryseosolibacter indicus TaxID=2782351 RepID=A0ABS5VMF3_9BACT|nr:DUF6048 family protein [Chryseosolibacter indicus]MBT1702624.1 hypothetical protein [Chryseosolibacter indicus]